MTPQERAAAVATAVGPNSIQYAFGGVVFAVSGCVAVGPAVSVTVQAWTGTGKNKVYLPVDNPYTFVNPPLQVPDGGTDAQGHATYTRSDVAAAKQMVFDAVTFRARQMGWSG